MTRLVFIAALIAAPAMTMAQSADNNLREDVCGAAGLQGLVGQTGAIAEMLEFPDRVVRIVGPETIVTTDYRVDRLNILIDEGIIDDIRCG